MKNSIIQTAKNVGFSDIGFLSARKYDELLLPQNVPFAKGDYDERINPFCLLENAKTVIVLLITYNTDKKGNISRYAHGKDYHLVLKEKSEPILSLLKEHDFKAEFFCDNANLNERFLAREAGLGFIGKNGFLISPEFGSFVFLAHIITDCEITPDNPDTNTCNNCGKCEKACPSDALKTKDFYTCLSYITQKKGELSESEKTLMKNSKMCWGCDLCQEVCPHNQNVPKTSVLEFSENLIFDIKEIPFSGREFKKIYHDRAFSWRGKAVLERNLNIINN